MLINPTKLTETGAEVLRAFLHQNPNFSGVFYSRDQHQRYTCVYQGKELSFELSHAMIRRTKNKNDGRDSYVEFAVSGDTIGMGSFGAVNDIIGSLSLSRFPVSHFAFKQKSDHSMIKTQKHYIDYPPSRSLQEFGFLKATRHSKAKYYQYVAGTSKSFIIATKARGRSLREIIDLEHKGAYFFSAEERLRLSLNIMCAVNTQVHNRGIVHRDIKPDNIIVDDDFNVSIIDYGLSCPEGTNGGVICGSIRYIEPALLSKKSLRKQQDRASDTYAVAVVLGEVWSHYCIRIQYDDVRKKFENAISSMLIESPIERASLFEMICSIDKMRIDHIKEMVASEFRDGVSIAHDMALSIRNMLLTDDHRGHTYSTMIQSIISGIAKLPADNLSVIEFMQTLGLRANKEIMHVNDLLGMFLDIRSALRQFESGLLLIIDATLRQKEMDDYLPDNMSKMRKENYDYILMLARHELRKLSRRPENLLHLVSLEERMVRKLSYFQRYRFATMSLGAWSGNNDLSRIEEQINSLQESPRILNDAKRPYILALCKNFIDNNQHSCGMKLHGQKFVPKVILAYIGRVVTAVAACYDKNELRDQILAAAPRSHLRYSRFGRLHQDIIDAVELKFSIGSLKSN